MVSGDAVLTAAATIFAVAILLPLEVMRDRGIQSSPAGKTAFAVTAVTLLACMALTAWNAGWALALLVASGIALSIVLVLLRQDLSLRPRIARPS